MSLVHSSPPCPRRVAETVSDRINHAISFRIRPRVDSCIGLLTCSRKVGHEGLTRSGRFRLGSASASSQSLVRRVSGYKSTVLSPSESPLAQLYRSVSCATAGTDARSTLWTPQSTVRSATSAVNTSSHLVSNNSCNCLLIGLHRQQPLLGTALGPGQVTIRTASHHAPV